MSTLTITTEPGSLDFVEEVLSKVKETNPDKGGRVLATLLAGEMFADRIGLKDNSEFGTPGAIVKDYVQVGNLYAEGLLGNKPLDLYPPNAVEYLVRVEDDSLLNDSGAFEDETVRIIEAGFENPDEQTLPENLGTLLFDLVNVGRYVVAGAL